MAEKNTIELFLKGYDHASGEIKKVEKSLIGMGTTAKKAVIGIEKGMNTAFKALGVAAVAGVSIAGYQLQKLARESVSLANAQEEAEAKLKAVIQATGKAAGYTADELSEMATAMQRVTTFGDEMIMEGMAILATFKNIRGEAFERTKGIHQEFRMDLRQNLR